MPSTSLAMSPSSPSSYSSMTQARPLTNRGIIDWQSCVLRVLWQLVHVVVSLWYIGEGVADAIESYLIGIGLLNRYRDVEFGKVKYLAVVVDSEEACNIPKVIQLLQWLASLGIKRLCLYDCHGVLKKNKEWLLDKLEGAILFEEAVANDLPVDKARMTVEFASVSDGKEAIAKAANLLYARYLKLSGNRAEQEAQIFSEAQLAETLRALGYTGPEPDLLLVYGPARCHLGFPPWRIRYTEIVHMGSMKSMRHGSLMKAICRFTMVRQNYGK